MANKLNNIKCIPKFKYTIGELPTSYLMSMTYQEQLTWLCNYINSTLINSVNETINTYNELLDEFSELQTNFDGLDKKVDDALVELDNNLEAGLVRLENEIDEQMALIREDIVSITTNIVNEAIVNHEITVALIEEYDSATEELTIKVVGQLVNYESERF